MARAAELALEAQDVERRRRRGEREIGGGGTVAMLSTMVTRLAAVIALSAPMRPGRPEAPDQLAGAVDRGGQRHVGETLGPGPSRRRGRRGADAARVEHLQRKRKRVDALQEKRPLLGQEGLEVGQVQDHLVGLDLGEVGVERGVQRDVVGEVPLEVQARRADRA